MNKISDLLEIMKEHQKADRLIQGTWLGQKDEEGLFRGCFFGCAMQTDSNAIGKACAKYELPLWLGQWSEKVFEGLPTDMAISWPVELLESLLHYKGDIEKLKHRLAIKRLTNLLPTENEDINNAIERVIEHHKNPSDHSAASSAESAWYAASSARSAASSASFAAHSSSHRVAARLKTENESNRVFRKSTGKDLNIIRSFTTFERRKHEVNI